MSHANWHYIRPNSDVIMFDVDVKTCVALFLTNIFHLKPFEKCPSPKTSKKALFCYSEKYGGKIQILFTMICIEFTAKYKIMSGITVNKVW